MRLPRGRRWLASCGLVLGAATCVVPPARAGDDGWATPAERSGFQETASLVETVDYLKRLEKASPHLRVTTFGKSGEGRDLILVIASKDRAFDAAAAARTGKPVVLLQAGIHAGEIDGKDAGLMLLREILVTKERAALLDRLIFLFMPVYNVDGHERISPYHRINQNGPRRMGWRTTSRNLNLNRDYLKADAVETRAWLKVFSAWRPDLTIDSHVTDGADYRYVVTYSIETGPNVSPPVAAWIRTAVLGHAVPAIAAAGHAIAPYIFLRDDTDPARGQTSVVAEPRFSTGYTVLQNRPAFLIETHMLKPFGPRVLATQATCAALLDAVAENPQALRTAVRAADAAAALPGRTPLRFRTTEAPRSIPFAGFSYRRELSDVSGAMRIIYGHDPIDLDVSIFDTFEIATAVDRPAAYLVPPQWTEAIEVLRAHGLRLKRLDRSWTAKVGGYRLSAPTWAPAPFEGRHQVHFTTERIDGKERTFPAGTVVVPLDQPGSAVAVHLLEPEGPDSLAGWGFFDAVFEQKEYAEAYVLEELARDMMSKDEKLRSEFEASLADPAFAASPQKRLDFFYRRSPYWDDALGLYPVGRITAGTTLPTRPD